MENNVLSLSLQEYIEKVEELQNKLNELEKSSADFKDSVKEAASEVDSFNSTLSDTIKQTESIQQNIESLTEKLEELQKVQIDEISPTVDIEAALSRLNELSDKMQALEENVTIRAKYEDILKLSDSLNEVQQKLYDIQTEIEIEIKPDSVDNFAAQITQLNDEVSKLQESLQNLQLNDSFDTKIFDEIEAKTESLQKSFDNLKVNVDFSEILQKIDVFSQKFDEIVAKIESFSSSSSSILEIRTTADTTGLDEVVEILQEIDNKIVTVSEKEIKPEFDGLPFQEAKERVQELKDGIAELQQELDKTDPHSDRFRELSADISGLQQDLDDLIGDGIDPTIDSIANLVREIDEMKNEIQNIEIGSEKFIELQEHLRESQERLAQLKKEQGDFSDTVASTSGAIVNAFQQMGISIGGLDKAFQACTVASNGFKVALDTLKAHPIIAVLTILFGLLFKIKDAFEKNEEASDAWKVAMAALQPIIDAVNRAIGWLAEGLAKVAQWMGEQLPGAIRFVGKYWNWMISLIGNVVEAFLFLPTVAAKVFDSVANTFKKGISWIVGAVADLLDVVGLGDSLHEVERDIDNFSFNVGGALEKFSGNVKKWFDDAGKSVTGFADKWAASTDTYIKKAKELDAVEDAIREQQVRNAESALKVAQLRKQAAEESDPTKRLEILKQIDAEIVKNGKEQVELARRQYELAQWYADQAPNSEADNERLARLKANVAQVETTYTQSLVKIAKQETSIQEALKKAAEAKTKAEKAEAEKQVKALQAAEKEKLRIAQEYVKNYNTLISNIQSETSSKESKVKSDKELLASLGMMTPEKAKEFENQIYQIRKEGLDKILAETEHAMKSEEITEEQRVQLQVKYSGLIVQTMTQEAQHKRELNKIALEQINKDTEDKLKELSDSYKHTDSIRNYIDNLKGLEPEVQQQILDTLSLKDNQKTLIFESFNGLSTELKEQISNMLQIDDEVKNKILEGISLNDDEKAQVLESLRGLSSSMQAEILGMMNVDPEIKQQLVTALSLNEEDKAQIFETLQNFRDEKLAAYEEEEMQEHEHQLRLLEIQKERLDAIREQFGEDSEFYKEAQAEYNAAYEAEEARHTEQMISYANKVNQAQKKSANMQKKALIELTKSVGSLFGTMADIMEQNIKQKVENGEITEEEAEKEFENVKKMQIAETVINTIAGAAGGLLQAIKTYPAPWGPILGGITAATATAAGIAQIAQIKAQKFGGSGSGAAGAASSVQTVDFQSVQTSPLLNEQADLAAMTNFTEQGDSQNLSGEQRVVILQSDIDDSQKQVQIRQTERTF